MNLTKIYKISGTGNSFVFVNVWDKDTQSALLLSTHTSSLKECAIFLCDDSHPWSGADGAVFIVPPSQNSSCQFQWIFLNKDGSSANMCGNAARCAVRFAVDMGICSSPLCFETLAGNIYGRILPSDTSNNTSDFSEASLSDKSRDELVEVTMTPVTNIQWQQNLELSSHLLSSSLPEAPSQKEDSLPQTIHFDFLDTGVPHIVLKVPRLHPLDAHKNLARELRQHPLFQPEGANVTFYEEVSNETRPHHPTPVPQNFENSQNTSNPQHFPQIRAATFERGVEDFTLACGTGAVAAAFSEYHRLKRNSLSSKICVTMPGGKLLVDLSHDKNPRLIGPVEYTSTKGFQI